MRISIFGLGYVGIANSICLAEMGHIVTGVDIKSWKVDMINKGHSPIKGKELEEKINKLIEKNLLNATTDTKQAVLHSEASFICVGTPSTSNGSIDLNNIKRVSEDIGMALKEKENYHLVVIRSTIIPETTKKTLIPILEETSNKKCGIDFGVCVNPEFLREGSMIEDFWHPGVMVIGAIDKRSGDLLEDVYKDIDCKLCRVNIKTAEMIKYIFNAFHALKISFMNEIGNICERYGVDAHLISEILCSDHKLNISPAYLRPGFAFGGSCLPKDLKALIHQSKQMDINPHILESILLVNEIQKEKALLTIKEMLNGAIKGKKIALIGGAYKENTDDIRESAAVQLVERLLDLQARVNVYDPLALENLDRRFKDRVGLPRNLEEALRDANLCVINLRYVEVDDLKKFSSLMRERNILDLTGINNFRELKNNPLIRYRGICW